MALFDIDKTDISCIDSSMIFILDANVLYWLYSGYPVEKKDMDKVHKYANFVGNLLKNGNRLGASAGNIQEVLNIIERTEYRLYVKFQKSTGGTHVTDRKAYRRDAVQRANVINKTGSVYKGIKSICEISEFNISSIVFSKFTKTLGISITELVVKNLFKKSNDN